MFEKSLIQETRQVWKLVVGLLAVTTGFFVMAYGLNDLRQPAGFMLTFTGMAVDLAGFAGMCVAIRCPTCGMRWLWAAVKNQEQSQWMNWLRAQRACPRCGYRPAGTQHR